MKKWLIWIVFGAGLIVLGMSLQVRSGELRTHNGKRTVWLKHSCPCDSGKVVHRWRIG